MQKQQKNIFFKPWLNSDLACEDTGTMVTGTVGYGPRHRPHATFDVAPGPLHPLKLPHDVVQQHVATAWRLRAHHGPYNRTKHVMSAHDNFYCYCIFCFITLKITCIILHCKHKCIFVHVILLNKRAQRALGRSPEEKVKGHSEAIYRGPLMLYIKYQGSSRI